MIYLLFIAFQAKHFICDYPLQNNYMLKKGSEKDWVFPLSLHCFVHALFTFIIAIFVTSFSLAIIVALIDFVIHFAMDRIKASKKMLGKYNPSDKAFWVYLGFDQMIHHLTSILLIWIILQ